jgi:hypothetical protein
MRVLHRLSHPASGALEVLKLVALVEMVVDHANKYALEHACPIMEHIGRVAFPLFAFVIAANLRWNTADPQRLLHAAGGVGHRLASTTSPRMLK